jgi:hypothetical protein
VPDETEAGSGATETDSGDAFKAKPEGGGCLNLGWGCLPVLVAGLTLVPLLNL